MVYLIGGMGWIPDPHDSRDICAVSNNVVPKLSSNEIPDSADNSEFATPIRDQGSLGSCVGFGVSGLMEYEIKKNYKLDIQLSPRYVYKVGRWKNGWTGDTGLFIRNGLGVASHGIPQEDVFPYSTERNIWDQNPEALVTVYANDYKASKYMRLDPNAANPLDTLQAIKTAIGINKYGVVFGFSCYSSLRDPNTQTTGKIPYRRPNDKQIGGHCVHAIGYSPDIEIEGRKGALRIKNSWSTAWGDNGFGWLPYEYVLSGDASDFWIILDEQQSGSEDEFR